MDKPLVSVIVPTRNSESFLEACLLSIKKQTYENIEIVVVDRFSNDNTKEIAKRYADKIFNTGPERSAQRNFGVANSAGKYVCVIDSDMTLDPGVIKKCVEAISRNPEIRGVIIPEESFGSGLWAECKKLERSFYVGIEWMEAARFFYKADYQSVGGYDEEMVSGEDWDLSQRIRQLGKFANIDKYIYHNEGRMPFFKTIKKKFYYAKKFSAYLEKNKGSYPLKNQIGLIKRYRLFFSDPKKLFKNPLIGFAMIFMKSCEFAFGGLGYLLFANGEEPVSSEKKTDDSFLPRISFIVPTFNEEKNITKCLNAIEKQDYPKEKIEILIIDGGSTDRTLELAKGYGAKIFSNPKRIAEYGKAIGIRESSGEYFVLLDADNEIVENDWLRKMVQPMIESKDLFGVESVLAHDKALSSLNRYFARMRIADPLARRLASRPEQVKKVNGYKIFVHKPNGVLITGANGFLWNKKMILADNSWSDKFEEANYSTYIHGRENADYAITEQASTRHFYTRGLGDYLKKRKKIALKMINRLKNREYVWIEKNNKFKIVFSVIFLATFVGPLLEAIYRCTKDRTLDWMWHPLISFLTIAVYSYYYILYIGKKI